MKYYSLLLPLFLFFSCGEQLSSPTKKAAATVATESVNSNLKIIIKDFEVAGAVLIYEEQKDQYYSNDLAWAKKGQLPASTFKIANSIIGLRKDAEFLDV